MTRREQKRAQPDGHRSATSRLSDAEPTTTSFLDPNGPGRPSSLTRLRQKSGSFLRELFGRPKTPRDPGHSPVPANVVAGGAPSTNNLYRPLSNPIAASGYTPSSPPRHAKSSSTISLPLSTPAATTVGGRTTLDSDTRSRTEDPAVVSGGVSRSERSRKDVLRTAYNGFKQILDIAAESADAFPPLKSVLGGVRAVLKASETYSSNKNDIAALSRRLDMLDAMKVPENVDAKAIGREALLPKLGEICADLDRISRQSMIEATANISQDEKTIAGWVSDLNDLLVDYQISMQQVMLGVALDIKSEAMDNDQRAQLDRLRRAKDAGFRSGNRRSCLEGTRKDVLNKIIAWTRDLNDRRVFWLSGNAGSGKSTISQTFAEKCSADGVLGASFFCSRDFEDRSNLNLIFPTLAFDLAYRYQTFRDALIPILKKRPNLDHESLTSQLETLLIAPLKASGISTTIVIDAIDECKDDKATSALLSVLERHIHSLSSAKIFITGRPESRIQAGFNLRELRAGTDVFLLHEVKRSSVDDDIRLFLLSEFSQLVQSRREILFPDPWPDAASLESLVQRAGGLFIFASTTCKLLSSNFHSPLELLELVLRSASSTGYEGQLELDALYTQILTENFKPSRSPFDVSKQVNSILGTVVVAPNPVSLNTLAILLGMDVHATLALLRSLESVIRVSSLPHIPIRAFHKSFPDFLTDKERCTELRFHVDSPQHHARLAIRCLELMRQGLKRNICNLPRYSMNVEVKDLADRRSKYISDALEYACTSWGQHLSQASRSSEVADTIVELMTIFMRYHFLWWLEVLSIGASLRTAVYTLRDAKAWLSQVNQGTKLCEFIEEGERFVLNFFDVIEVSASHIYDSAVFLSPENSIIREYYKADSRRAWNATDNSWDAFIRRTDIKNGLCVVFSHNSDRVAACGGYKESGFLVIIEVATGIVLSRFSGHDRTVRSVAFSPDDSLLVSGSEDHTIRLWDVTTGGLVKTLRLEGEVRSVGFSHDGAMIACNAGIWDGMLDGVVRRFDRGVMTLAWSPSNAQVAVGYEDGRIKTLDVSNGVYQEMAPAHTGSITSLAYTRDGAKLVSSSGNQGGGIKIHNVRVDIGKVLQELVNTHAESVCFSLEGTRLVMAQGRLMVVHDLASSTNVAEFKQSSSPRSVSVSPDGQSIALADFGKLSIWQMNSLMQSSEAVTQHSSDVRSVEISPDLSFIASGSYDNTVKLWDFATGTCTHTFKGHSGFVLGVAISPDSSFVASGSSDKTIRIWRVEDHALAYTLRGHNDSVTGVAFSPDGQRIASISRDEVARLWDIKEEITIGEFEVTGFKEYSGIKFSDDGTGITTFDGEKSKSWTMADSSVSSADIKQYPISFIPCDHPFENQSSPLYEHGIFSQWITDRSGIRVCWLPQDLRSWWTQASNCKGSKVALGLRNGSVCCFDFGSFGLLSND